MIQQGTPNLLVRVQNIDAEPLGTARVVLTPVDAKQPVARLEYTELARPPRSDRKVTALPSGFHLGRTSCAGSNVRRDAGPRGSCLIQMSMLSSSSTVTAT